MLAGFRCLNNMISAKIEACGDEGTTHIENEQSWCLFTDFLSEMGILQFLGIFYVYSKLKVIQILTLQNCNVKKV